jgi:hypothetical protein
MREPTISELIATLRFLRSALRTRPAKMRDSELDEHERRIDALVTKLVARAAK